MTTPNREEIALQRTNALMARLAPVYDGVYVATVEAKMDLDHAELAYKAASSNMESAKALSNVLNNRPSVAMLDWAENILQQLESGYLPQPEEEAQQ
jgi:hypothetical protein